VKKMISLIVMLLLIMQLAGCGVAELVGAFTQRADEEMEEGADAEDTGQSANTTLSESGDVEEYMPVVPDDAAVIEDKTENDADREPVITLGEERIFFENSQTAYSFLSSPQYISICHALFQSESASGPKAYTLQIRDGSFDKDGNYVGMLHWQSFDFRNLRACFTDKNLYTFAQNNQIPKLDNKGPLGLIFEDEVLDPDNLNIIMSDLMENSFGASQIAAELANLLCEKENVELRLFQFDCEGFNGNMSFPSYSTEGTIVRTVEKYRGSAAMYIVAVGPTQDVESFAARFDESLPDNISYNEAIYVNGEKYPGYTGINSFEIVDSLNKQMSNGSCETLNYTVNARPVEGEELVFDYNTDHTVKESGYKIAFYAEVEEGSPLASEEDVKVRIENMKVNGDVLQPEHNISIDMKYVDKLTVRTENADDGYISEAPGLYLTVAGIDAYPESVTSIEFDLVADIQSGTGWVDSKSATILEFQSLTSLLPQSETAENRLVWKAGCTDILARTLDLTDVDNILGSCVTSTKNIEHFSIKLNGPADTSGRWDALIYGAVGITAAAVVVIIAFTFSGSNSKKKKRRR